MTDALLPTTAIEEELSRAYVAAVAAAAGYSTSEQNLDFDGVDVQVHAGGPMRPSLAIQLKATINLGEMQGGEYQYPLKVRNYNLLRERTMVPRILVLLSLPSDRDEWLRVSADELVMKKCAYWASLEGFPETTNSTSVTITIKDHNRFDVQSLQDLMNMARTGVIV